MASIAEIYLIFTPCHYDLVFGLDNQLKKIYLDFAAATPMLPEVEKEMRPFYSGSFANPGAVHSLGRKAKEAVDDARQRLARVLGVRKNEVYFTASGTEANNLAIYGLLREVMSQGRDISNCEVITTKLEHPSVLAVLEVLANEGLKVSYAPLNSEGLIEITKFKKLLSPKTVLVSVAYVSSEIGVVQDIKRLGREIRKYNSEHGLNLKFHVDGAQAPWWLPCDVHRLGVDMLSLDAGKCGGPKGTGVLAKLSSTKLKGFVLGGGQEDGLRAGTENVAGIVGSVKAIELAQVDYESRAEKTTQVRDEAIEIIKAELSQAVLNGAEGDERVANNINISLPGYDTEYLTVYLDSEGVMVSTKSACAGAGGGESTAVLAISGDNARAHSTLRLTLGPDTDLEDLKTTVKHIQDFTVLMDRLTKSK